jgi:hypothetical protein
MVFYQFWYIKNMNIEYFSLKSQYLYLNFQLNTVNKAALFSIL